MVNNFLSVSLVCLFFLLISLNLSILVNMQIDSETIFKNYSSNLSDIINILRYLHTYPKLLSKIEIEELIKPNLVKEHLESWVKLYSEFENKIDIDFFEPYWLPIETNGYGLFIDLSNKNYPVFETRYFFYEPFQWYKKYIVKNIFELLLSPEDKSIEILDIIEFNDRERRNLIKALFNKN